MHIISNGTAYIDFSSRTCTVVVNMYFGAFIFFMCDIICHICAIGSTTICTYGASSCHTTWISENATNTKLNRDFCPF